MFNNIINMTCSEQEISVVLVGLCLVVFNHQWCKAWKNSIIGSNSCLVLIDECFWMGVLRAMKKIPIPVGLSWSLSVSSLSCSCVRRQKTPKDELK